MKRLLPLLTLLAACVAGRADDTPPPAWIIGTYHYSGSGRVAGKFPWEANSNLVLDKDATFTLTINVHIDDKSGGDSDTDETYGSYYVDGDRLVLEPANDDDKHEFDIRGRDLVARIPWTGRLALKGLRIPDPVFVKSQ